MTTDDFNPQRPGTDSHWKDPVYSTIMQGTSTPPTPDYDRQAVIRITLFSISKQPWSRHPVWQPNRRTETLLGALDRDGTWGEPIVQGCRTRSAARLATHRAWAEYLAFHGCADMLVFNQFGPVGNLPVT